MTHIKESLRVACPYVRARSYLHELLQDAALSRTPQLLHLSAAVPGLPVSMEKGVDVMYAHAADPMHFDEPWAISWKAEKGGTYPSFSGTLTVRSDEDYTGAVLELEGQYTPPMGPAGQLFDAAFGRRIATATMQNLLSNLGTLMTERYKAEEAAKPHV